MSYTTKCEWDQCYRKATTRRKGRDFCEDHADESDAEGFPRSCEVVGCSSDAYETANGYDLCPAHVTVLCEEGVMGLDLR